METWTKHIEVRDSSIRRFMLNSTAKDGGSQIKDSVMLIGLVNVFFFFDICFLLVFIMLFELCLT